MRRLPLFMVVITAGIVAGGIFAGARILERVLEQKRPAQSTSIELPSPPLLQVSLNQASPRQRPELRGVWIHVYGPQDWEKIARTLRAANFNAIFLRVARGGESLYPSRVLPREAWAERSGRDELQMAIAAAHEFGLELHAWKVCYHLGSLVRDARQLGGRWSEFYETLRKEGRLVTDSQGRSASWLNPADPRNLELELAVAEEVLSQYDVDGYHLDYIRYPDDPGFDFDYGPVSRLLFEARRGHPVSRWPEEVLRGVEAAEYLRWQQDVITETVWRIRQVRDRVNSDASLSAAVWRNIGLHRATVKQDWPRWAELRLVDFLVLMNYERDLDAFLTQLEDALMRTAGRVPLVAGIGSWRLTPQQVLRQVEATRQLGADGFVLFSYNAERIDEQLQLLARQATRLPAAQGCKGPLFDIEPVSDTVRVWTGHRVFRRGSPFRLVVRSRFPVSVKADIVARSIDGNRVFGAEGVELTSANEAHVTLPLVDQPVQLEVQAFLPHVSSPAVCRSGWFVPVSDSLFRQFLATTEPPALLRRPAVGVFVPSRGSSELYAALRRLIGNHAVPVYSLAPAHLQELDSLVVPPFTDLGVATPETMRAVRAWVAEGGTCVFLDDAVGRFPYPAFFPEVGWGEKRIPCAPLRWTDEARDWIHECDGHVALHASSGTDMLAREAPDGSVVGVVDSFGKGRVILLGLPVDLVSKSAAEAPLSTVWRQTLNIEGE